MPDCPRLTLDGITQLKQAADHQAVLRELVEAGLLLDHPPKKTAKKGVQMTGSGKTELSADTHLRLINAHKEALEMHVQMEGRHAHELELLQAKHAAENKQAASRAEGRLLARIKAEKVVHHQDKLKALEAHKAEHQAQMQAHQEELDAAQAQVLEVQSKWGRLCANAPLLASSGHRLHVKQSQAELAGRMHQKPGSLPTSPLAKICSPRFADCWDSSDAKGSPRFEGQVCQLWCPSLGTTDKISKHSLESHGRSPLEEIGTLAACRHSKHCHVGLELLGKLGHTL
ncbi:hypothetical protein WJX73_010002 [Symbiochloris irregularis]|uniref:Uncharacterized protein n=1 Tax=Symbiochloris irregularis TaxID=706552 RepID=A0AAW1PV83_9CHLO